MGKPKKQQVTIDDLWIAAQWLDVYEGAEDKAACARVADMLHEMCRKREETAQARKALQRAGYPATPKNIAKVLKGLRSEVE